MIKTQNIKKPIIATSILNVDFLNLKSVLDKL